jgi:tRNA pseudouridine55 synthase
MEGFLLVDKPEGWTSFDVVNYVRRMVANIEGRKPKNVKVGHTGTLDPAATGLLVLCIGKATKQVPNLIKQDKTYQVELTLGKKSTTGDKEGKIEDWGKKTEEPSSERLEEVVESFVGEIFQVPPAFSAIKVNGKRAYDLARAGKEVLLEPRKVKIYSISDIKYDFPRLTFTTSVGSGTYIRSLAEDIGKKLGCGAYMSNLRRTTIGQANINNAVAVSELTEDSIKKALLLTDDNAIISPNI